MKFVELTEEEYTHFWQEHQLKTFLSSPKIGKLREKSNWKTYFVGVKENKKILCAAMLVSKKKYFNRYEFYSPRGLLIDFNDFNLLTFFTKELTKYIKNKKGYVLRIDPYIINKERDIDGNIVEGGEDNTNIKNNLIKLGFKQVNSKELEQVGWMFSLDLEGKTKEQILKEMKPNTRNTIRKAEKIGIKIRELSYDELEEFQNIMIETGKRKDFSICKLSYFQNMYKLFSKDNEVKYYISELNLKEYIDNLNKEKLEKEQKLASLNNAKYNEGQKKNLNNEIASIKKRIKEANNIINKEKKEVITLSGSMFMLIKPEIIYLSSGNYEEYMMYNSQYLIQWLLIKYGIENGFKKHNFYGIPANINTHPKDYGIYEFKRGFNGYVEELIGEFVLPISYHYYIFKLIKVLKGVKK